MSFRYVESDENLSSYNVKSVITARRHLCNIFDLLELFAHH